ncbi:hypothetical protein CU669_05345 [Paramagnetospirillum kuznetsovii]|uniref:Zinc finger/thioredoxin putative domain-containing protein n=1 Tax=Paramagnetospirillum kuznetsovii TaxID=2053833 RepID=A0A364P0G7_9PROT|nr:DUF3426 domain-containing protein [Paramagnetospirillum kuznetsovii]RAU22814.1 hypothetical protein CU669_05345 [Paramagnetospirillum kuznetsovii]
MLITCPSCSTNFSIPDSALGTTGRKLKCAKCGHKWHQQPMMVMEDDDTDFDLSGPSFSAPPREEPSFAPPPPPPAPPRAAAQAMDSDLDDLNMDAGPAPNFGARTAAAGKDDESLEGLLDAPQPIPDVFSTAAPEGKKGTGFLWFLLILLVLGGLGGAGYYFQDQLVEAVPEAGEMLAQTGLRREKPGAGLELRKAGTPERFVHNDTDVLVVRGIIANITDRVRPVPTMKLVLMDKNKQPVQEKLSQPPVSALDPQGTASFKIMLERPDPNAVEVVVVFVESAADGKPVPPPVPKAPAAPPVPDVAPAAPAAPAPAPAAEAPAAPPAAAPAATPAPAEVKPAETK